MTDSSQRLALLALIAWALADRSGATAMIAAFVGGLVVGPAVGRVGDRLIRFTEAQRHLLNLSVFFIFGALVSRSDPALEFWEVALYGPLGLTLIRMPPSQSSPELEYVAELERLAKLRDQGIVSEQEFEAKKKQILGI